VSRRRASPAAPAAPPPWRRTACLAVAAPLALLCLGPLAAAAANAAGPTANASTAAAANPGTAAAANARTVAAAAVIAASPTATAVTAMAWPSLPSLRTLRALGWLADPHLPAWAERWLHNPRERTAAAIDAVRRGDAAAAVGPADAALRLLPDSPLASYNAGSARLATGDKKLAEAAAPLLAAGAKGAARDLQVAADYNLGNAHLTAGQFAGAIEAYKQALRLAPGSAAAKYNLELALTAEQQQRQNPPRAIGPRGGGGTPRPGDQRQTAGQGGPGQSGANPQPGKPGEQGASSAQGPRPGDHGAAPGQPGPRGQASPRTGQQPLAGYQDQPEMSANQAAAVLEAVENLERQQRREAAAKEARRRAARGEDW
jgi:tetratricopeptide (TPR) repeat protein